MFFLKDLNIGGKYGVLARQEDSPRSTFTTSKKEKEQKNKRNYSRNVLFKRFKYWWEICELIVGDSRELQICSLHIFRYLDFGNLRQMKHLEMEHQAS